MINPPIEQRKARFNNNESPESHRSFSAQVDDRASLERFSGILKGKKKKKKKKKERKEKKRKRREKAAGVRTEYWCHR